MMKDEMRKKPRATSTLRAKLRSVRHNNDFILGAESQLVPALLTAAFHPDCLKVEAAPVARLKARVGTRRVFDGNIKRFQKVYRGDQRGRGKQEAKGRIKLAASHEHSAHPLHLKELEILAAAMQRQLAAMVSDHLLLFGA
jgi:hypothetical protein